MAFQILAQDGAARAGVLETPRGPVETPVFMPVATQASVKALDSDDIRRLGSRAILANSYHLYLRPGTETVKAAGGLHRFMDYDGFILTDSGGFQVLSLSDLREIDDEGVTFRSHLDGSEHRLTPESVIGVQAALGSDGWTTLDECPPYPADEAHARRALERTMAWIDRSVPAVAAAREAGAKCLFFPILQGSFFAGLRLRAAEHMNAVPADGVSIGGFMVGESKEMTWSMLAQTAAALRADRPRYLMGVGTPLDLWDAVACGVDMMDCVYPTRVARTGQVMASGGKYNVTNARFRRDFTALDPGCSCFVCARYTRAYLGHLLRAKELSAYRLLSYHNLHYMDRVISEIRAAVKAGRFEAARAEFRARYGGGA
ncbi:MAG: tRNA guanosine(34) transglycosylase Tgt [Elusimicrobia bacterium RBG_16_66_12]|nr:MAG: tRNA guanosine(34) transglycosylase Tgt [Elusimicrobia bacterium RBG_16_66_12]